MWALGVVLYTMLYGQFPFYDSVPQELFNKIKAAEFSIPDDGRVSEDTRNLIRRLLVTDPEKRQTAAQVKHSVESIILMWRNMSPIPTNLQVVPQMEDAERPEALRKNDYGDNLLLNLGNLRETGNENKHASKLLREGKTGIIPVHKLGEDARPLSAEEYRLYSQVITQMRGGRVRSNRQSSPNNQVLVRPDKLQGYQRVTGRPNLSAPTTTSSLPALVPDQAEVLDLSQGPRRDEPPSRSTVPPYVGQGMPAPSQTRPGVVRSNSALSLVGALRRLGTRVNLVPVSSEGGSRSRSSSHGSRSGSGSSSSRSSSRHHRHSTRHRDSDRSRSRRHHTRDTDGPSIVPAPTFPAPAPILNIPAHADQGLALPLAEASRLLGITLEPIPRQPAPTHRAVPMDYSRDLDTSEQRLLVSLGNQEEEDHSLPEQQLPDIL